MTFSFWPVVVVHICSDLISDKKGTGTKKRELENGPVTFATSGSCCDDTRPEVTARGICSA